MSFIAVDIDGTIADVSHRLHHLQRKDWDTFFKRCIDDGPINWIIQLVSRLQDHYEVVFLTGRPFMVHAHTRAWLALYFGVNNPLSHADIFMRNNGDHRHDTTVKPELMKKAEKEHGQCDFIIEDRDSMVKKWRELGYNVLQCAEGDF